MGLSPLATAVLINCCTLMTEMTWSPPDAVLYAQVEL
jgi:hypothetical protein